MNRNSNTYTIVYATVMVILVAIGLAFTSQALREDQKRNEDIDKMQQILSALNIHVTPEEAMEKYDSVITDAFLVDSEGNVVEGTNGKGVDSPAFTYALAEIKNSDKVPVFLANVDGAQKHVLGMYGAGLWGPIWGYISVNDDKNTIFGANFSHAGETPGLGAEITTEHFYSQFEGKELYKDGEFKSVAVVKSGHSAPGQDYVDGISGGTLTSQGVHHMLYDSLKKYDNYLSKKD